MVPTQIICSPEPHLFTAIKDVFKQKQNFPMYPKQPFTTHYNYVRKVWKMAKFFELKASKHRKLTKLVVNCLKKLPLERHTSLETAWTQINEYLMSVSGDALKNPPFSEFMQDFRRVFRFSEDPATYQNNGPGFNLREWSQNDMLLKQPDVLRQITIASEFI